MALGIVKTTEEHDLMLVDIKKIAMKNGLPSTNKSDLIGLAIKIAESSIRALNSKDFETITKLKKG